MSYNNIYFLKLIQKQFTNHCEMLVSIQKKIIIQIY